MALASLRAAGRRWCLVSVGRQQHGPAHVRCPRVAVLQQPGTALGSTDSSGASGSAQLTFLRGVFKGAVVEDAPKPLFPDCEAVLKALEGAQGPMDTRPVVR